MAKKAIKKIARSFRFIKAIKPSFFIIGTQKSGTSFLFHFLNKQPRLSSPYKKELDFFSTDSNFNKGEKWYMDHFFFRRDHTSCEVSPNYLYYLKSHQRIFDYNPNIKLIILLRNPIERAFSAWNMHKNIWETEKDHINKYYSILDEPQKSQGISFMSKEKFPSFKEAILDELHILEGENFILNEPGFISRGLYHYQIKSLLSFFNKKQILLIEYEELKDIKVLSLRLQNFLNIPIQALELEKALWFKGKYSEQIDEESKILLQEYFKDKNEKLFQLIQKEYSW